MTVHLNDVGEYRFVREVRVPHARVSNRIPTTEAQDALRRHAERIGRVSNGTVTTEYRTGLNGLGDLVQIIY